MKASELLRDQVKVIKNFLPEALKTIRDTTAGCLESPMIEFAQMGQELASKEAMFLAMGGFQVYFDMMDLLIKVVDAAEKMQQRERDGS
jgi:hypothetical protein